ncbi:IS481 family transposase [uncultured Jatrophihabitans sp.]|uniref:IS481 family transposase n=1 Tax=uncultured Jatrophihabitans sp. TaxID=1610747 RepID=UPI0035C94565
MPLKVMDVVELRLRVIADLQAGLSAREVARRHRIGKSQVCEWWQRYRLEGAQGLVPRSRRPLRSPAQLDAVVEDEIVRWRKARPRWGAKKIQAMLAAEGWVPTPAVSTVHQVLVRRGLIDRTRRSRQPAAGWQRFTRDYPNDLWQIDATQHRLANGRAFWVVDLVDDHSRFLLGTHVCPAPTGDAAWTALRDAVRAHGLPRQLLSDNGLLFTGRLHGVTVAFERQARAAGIELIHSRVRHPETVGKLERQHATQNAWLADHGAPRSLTAAQAVLTAYRHDYNTARPHEAIEQRFPADVYRPEPGVDLPAIRAGTGRPLPRRLPETPRRPQRQNRLLPPHMDPGPAVGRHHRRPAPRPRTTRGLLRSRPHRHHHRGHPARTNTPRTPTQQLTVSGMSPERTVRHLPGPNTGCRPAQRELIRRTGHAAVPSHGRRARPGRQPRTRLGRAAPTAGGG